jgi:hypothetical protein
VSANLDLQERQLQLAKQIANIVDHHLTSLANVNMVRPYLMKKICVIDYWFYFIFSDTYVSTQVLPTPGFYSDPPAVPPVEPINYSTSGSSSSSPLQSEWLATSCPQHVVSPQSNFNNSNGFRTEQQPQQQDYSSYYWNNWDYSPPFYPTSMTNPTFYSNTVFDPHSSSYCFYSPETTNQFYDQSCM